MTSPAQAFTVIDLYRRLLEAWNARDAEAFAELFADEGVSIGFDGSQAAGAEIRDHLTPIFRDHATATYLAKTRDIRCLAEDVVLLRAIVGMVSPGAHALNAEVNALQSLVAVQQEDTSWSIVLLQNTPARYHGRPELVEQHTAALEQLREAGITLAHDLPGTGGLDEG